MDSQANIDDTAQSLVARIAAGDLEAESSLVNKYWKSLQFILSQQNIDPELAADICQDTFILVLQKLRANAINKPSALGAFIRSIAINLVIESKRKGTRQKTDCNQHIDAIFNDLSESPERSISHSSLVNLVQTMVNELNTQRDREILQQTYFYHQDKSQVCDFLSVTPEHFDRVLFRAKSRLKILLMERYNIDLSKHPISQFILSIATASFFCSQLLTGGNLVTNKIEVREFISSSHLANIDKNFNDLINSTLLFEKVNEWQGDKK